MKAIMLLALMIALTGHIVNPCPKGVLCAASVR